MTEAQKKKNRAIAAKLSKPTPVELPSGKWRCQVMVKGRRVSVVEDDPKTAHAKALALRSSIIEKEEKKGKTETLSEAIDRFIDRNGDAFSPATVRGYENIKNHRFQWLMKMEIGIIDYKDVQRAINEEVKKVSTKTVSNAYGLVRTVLSEYDVDLRGIKLPQIIKKHKRYMQPEEIGALIEAVKGDSCECEILIAVWLGMRRSEIIGLCWDCVDFDKKTLTVRRTMVPDKNHKWVLKEGAKTMSSQRVVSCPDYIMDLLRERYTGAQGQIFSIHPDTLRRHIHKACARAGVTDTTVHGLRHTNAAVMKSLGVSDAHAMARGGWSSEKTYKQTYSYVFDQDAKSGDNIIDSYFQEKMHTNLHTKSDNT